MRCHESRRLNRFGSWAGGRNPCERRTAELGRAPRPDIPPLLMDSTPSPGPQIEKQARPGSCTRSRPSPSWRGTFGARRPSPCVPRIGSHQGGRDPAQASPGSCREGGARAPPPPTAWGWHRSRTPRGGRAQAGAGCGGSPPDVEAWRNHLRKRDTGWPSLCRKPALKLAQNTPSPEADRLTQ